MSDTHRPENSHPDSLLLFEIPLLFRHDRTSLMRAKSASACCAGAPGAEHLLLPWGYSCDRGNPKNKGEEYSDFRRFSAKALQTNGFDFMNPKFPINHEHSCLILCHIDPLSSRWNSLYKTVFPAYFCVPPYCTTAGRLASKGIFHEVCLVQSAQNVQHNSCAKLPLQIPGRQAIIISYNE